MRLWHYKLLQYLPDAQFKGQLRELVAIMHDWRDKGQTNHLLINHVMEYQKGELTDYFLGYCVEYERRYEKAVGLSTMQEFAEFSRPLHYPVVPPYRYWHDDRYLRICMANLYEKYLGVGKSRITEEEWNCLKEGYREITGEEYQI